MQDNVFKSKEEAQFAEWCEEAVAAGLLSGWWYEEVEYELLPKQVDENKKSLFRNVSYTPDFTVRMTDLGKQVLGFLTYDIPNKRSSAIEVKGAYDPFRGDDRYIQLIRKLMYRKFNMFINLVKIPIFFKKTWLPTSMCTTKSGKPTKLSKKCLTIQQFRDNIKIQQELL